MEAEAAIAAALAEGVGVDSEEGTVVGIAEAAAAAATATAVVIVVVVVVIVAGMTEGGDAAGILPCRTPTPRASAEARGRELTRGLGAVEACDGNVFVGLDATPAGSEGFEGEGGGGGVVTSGEGRARERAGHARGCRRAAGQRWRACHAAGRHGLRPVAAHTTGKGVAYSATGVAHYQ